MTNNEEDFAKTALELGGKPVRIIPSASTTINIFDFDKSEITEELLNQKEQNLRAFLEEANKYYMQGSLSAVEHLDKFDELPELNDNSEWKERVKKLFQEFAEQISIKNLRSRVGMSQNQFANYMEIPVRTLQEWEQGKRTPSSYIVKMIHRIIHLEEERKKDFTKKVLVEQYTERDYTREQLIQIYMEKMKVCKKENIIIEFIAQKPVLDENGQTVNVTSDFPAELNIYTYKVPNEIEQFINTLNKGDLVVVEITNGLKKSIYFKDFHNELFEGIDQYTNTPVKVRFSLIKSINLLE